MQDGKIVGMGEILTDMVMNGMHPAGAVVGGSVVNALVSLGRMGLKPSLISEIGTDKLGQHMRGFLQDNGVTTDLIIAYEGRKSALSLAYVDPVSGNAAYDFYTDYPPAEERMTTLGTVGFTERDVLLTGSYFAIRPDIHTAVESVIAAARAANAIVYYDPNFRASHLPEIGILRPIILQNIEAADIVRGSDEDFEAIFGTSDGRQIRQRMNAPEKILIVTRGARGAELWTDDLHCAMAAEPLGEVVSTIGAGDNFNAGIIYSLQRLGIQKKALPLQSKTMWERILRCASAFSGAVCRSMENYIGEDFRPTLDDEVEC